MDLLEQSPLIEDSRPTQLGIDANGPVVVHLDVRKGSAVTDRYAFPFPDIMIIIISG